MSTNGVTSPVLSTSNANSSLAVDARALNELKRSAKANPDEALKKAATQNAGHLAWHRREVTAT